MAWLKPPEREHCVNKDAEPLGRDIIHSVSNPIPKLTGALHVYGGDFFGVPRSEWDAETLLEQQCSGEKMARRFEAANALLKVNTSHVALCRADQASGDF
jgi:predicted metal-dependent enzyme (double-stranded beta helix superfamily)